MQESDLKLDDPAGFSLQPWLFSGKHVEDLRNWGIDAGSHRCGVREQKKIIFSRAPQGKLHGGMFSYQNVDLNIVDFLFTILWAYF